MSEALEDIVEWLLGEIVYSGFDGVSLGQLLLLINDFHAGRRTSGTVVEIVSASGSSQVPTQPPAPIDHSVKEEVWKRLVLHPDVLIGDEGIGNYLSLSEIEKLPPVPVTEVLSELNSVPETGESSAPSSSLVRDANAAHETADKIISHGATTAPNGTLRENGHISDPALLGRGQAHAIDSTEAKPNGRSTRRRPGKPNSQEESSRLLARQPRIKVSKARMCLEFTGDSLEKAAVPRLDWVCLCTIAASREKGISQVNLGKMTGQDKQSVPRRCDRLEQKGYVVKTRVITRGAYTDTVVLKKFAVKAADPAQLPYEILREKFTPIPGHERWTGDFIDQDAMARSVLALIKAWGRISREDLLIKMKVNEEIKLRATPKGYLEKVLQKTLELGLVELLLEPLSETSKSTSTKKSYQLLRDPTPEDWAKFQRRKTSTNIAKPRASRAKPKPSKEPVSARSSVFYDSDRDSPFEPQDLDAEFISRETTTQSLSLRQGTLSPAQATCDDPSVGLQIPLAAQSRGASQEGSFFEIYDYQQGSNMPAFPRNGRLSVPIETIEVAADSIKVKNKGLSKSHVQGSVNSLSEKAANQGNSKNPKVQVSQRGPRLPNPGKETETLRRRGRPKKLYALFTSHEEMLRQEGVPGVYRDIPDYEPGKIVPAYANNKSRPPPYYICFKSEVLKTVKWMSQPEARRFVEQKPVAKLTRSVRRKNAESSEIQDIEQHEDPSTPVSAAPGASTLEVEGASDISTTQDGIRPANIEHFDAPAIPIYPHATSPTISVSVSKDVKTTGDAQDKGEQGLKTATPSFPHKQLQSVGNRDGRSATTPRADESFSTQQMSRSMLSSGLMNAAEMSDTQYKLTTLATSASSAQAEVPSTYISPYAEKNSSGSRTTTKPYISPFPPIQKIQQYQTPYPQSRPQYSSPYTTTTPRGSETLTTTIPQSLSLDHLSAPISKTSEATKKLDDQAGSTTVLAFPHVAANVGTGRKRGRPRKSEAIKSSTGADNDVEINQRNATDKQTIGYEKRAEVQRHLEAPMRAAEEMRLASEAKAAADKKFTEEIEAAKQLLLHGIEHRISVTMNNTAGNLYLAKDKLFLIFQYMDTSQPPLILSLNSIKQHPTISTPGTDPMFLCLNFEGDQGMAVPYKFRLPKEEATLTAANTLRSKIVLHILRDQINQIPSSSVSEEAEDIEEVPDTTKKFVCEKCDGRWLNAEGLKYHLTKARVVCNPSWVPPLAGAEAKKKGRPKKSKLEKGPFRAATSEVVETPRKRTSRRRAARETTLDSDDEGEELVAADDEPTSYKRVSNGARSTLEADYVPVTDDETEQAPSPSLSTVNSPRKSTKLPMNKETGDFSKIAPPKAYRPRVRRRRPGAFTLAEAHRQDDVDNEESVDPSATGQVIPTAANSQPATISNPDQGSIPVSQTMETVPDINSLLQIDWQNSKDLTPAQARLHREIIMYIIEQSGGIFPGKRGIWYAFCLELFKRQPSSKLQRFSVCNAAVNALADSGKLLKIEFTFRSPRGGMLARQVLAIRGTDPLADAVLKCKNLIKDHAPDHYCPEEWSLPRAVKAKLDALEGNFAFVGKASALKNTVIENPVVLLSERQQAINSEREQNIPSASGDSATRSGRGRRINKPVRYLDEQFTVPTVEMSGSSSEGAQSSDEDIIDINSRRETELSLKDESLDSSLGFTDVQLLSPFLTISYMQDPETAGWSLVPAYHDYHLRGPTKTLTRLKRKKLPQHRKKISSVGDKASSTSEPKPKRQYIRRDKSYQETKGKKRAALDSGSERPAGKRTQLAQSNQSFIDFLPKNLDGDLVKSGNPGLSSLPDTFYNFPKDYSHAQGDGAAFLKAMPKTMRAIVYFVTSEPGKVSVADITSPHESFLNEVTAVAKWEQTLAPRMLQNTATLPGSIFLNHECALLPREDSFKSRSLTWSKCNAFTLETLPYETLESIDSDGEEIISNGHTAEPPRKRYRVKSTRLAPLNRTYRETESPEARENRAAWDSYKQRYTTALPSDLEGLPGDIMECFDLAELDEQHVSKVFRRRAIQIMSVAEELQLIVAVVMIRTLTGGLERTIDWVLVTNLFPRYSLRYVLEIWSKLADKHKALMQRITENFPDIYLEAYENEEVASIDYDHLLDYDWEGLLEWTLEKMEDDLSEAAQRLPSSREKVFRNFDFNVVPTSVDYDSYFESSKPIVRRMEAVIGIPHVIPLTPSFESPRSRVSQLLVAKSWARANIMTPDHAYDPISAQAKLSQLPKSILTQALDALRVEKILIQKNRGRAAPGRGFYFSETFWAALRQNLSEKHFVWATKFKSHMDNAFFSGQSVELSWTADEGQIMTITNLQASGRIEMIQHNVPMEKMGILDGQYQTRYMNKDRIIFGLSLIPTGKYIYDSQHPTLQILYDGTHSLPLEVDGALPIWVDINGNLIRETLRTVLIAMFSVVGLRAGIPSSELLRILSPAMEMWELKVLIDWCVSIGVMEACMPAVDGWTLGEWWWLVVGKV